MSALANVFFSDLFTEISPGSAMGPGLVGSATGTTSTAAIQLGGPVPFSKWLFDLSFLAGSASGSVSMFLATASASGGTFTSISQTMVSMVTTLSLSTIYDLKIDSRDVAFAVLGTGSIAPTWVKAVVAVSGAAINGALKILGWEATADPNSAFTTSTNPLVAQVTFY